MADKSFGFIRDCLKQFDYPYIYTLDDCQIAEILSTSNRRFLIVWLFNQIDQRYGAWSNGFEQEALLRLLYQNGFCLESQARNFMEGHLPIGEQMAVLRRMLQFLKSVKNKPVFDPANTVSVDYVKHLKELDTNLFSALGPKKVMPLKVRQQKIVEYEREIEILKSQIESLDITKSRNGTSSYTKTSQAVEPTIIQDYNVKHKLEQLLEMCERNLPEFKNASLEIIKRVNTAENDSSQQQIEAGSEGLLKEISQNINTTKELLNNVNVILKALNHNEPDLQQSAPNPNINNLLQEISALSMEVSKDRIIQD